MEKTNKRQIRFDLKKKILMLGVLPVLVLGLMVIFIAQTIVRDSLLKEIKDALQSAATSTFAAYDQNSGDYIKTERRNMERKLQYFQVGKSCGQYQRKDRIRSDFFLWKRQDHDFCKG